MSNELVEVVRDEITQILMHDGAEIVVVPSDDGAEPDFMAACSCGIYSPRAPRSNWAVQSWLALHRGDGHIVEEIKA